MASHEGSDTDSQGGNLSSTPTPHSLHRNMRQQQQQQPQPILINSASTHSVQSLRRPSTGRSRSHSLATSTSSSSRGGRLSDQEEEEDEDDEEVIARQARRRHRGKAVASSSSKIGEDEDEEDEGESDETEQGRVDGEEEEEEEDPITLKERQSMINVEHPFGLPIWKPALYKKSRSVNRHADEGLHSIPSAQAERHLLPGNIFWVVVFGWWLSLVCFLVAGLLSVVPNGGKRYATLVFGLGWYIAWPFGKYVEGDLDPEEIEEGEGYDTHSNQPSTSTVRHGLHPSAAQHDQSASWGDISEETPLIAPRPPRKSYGVSTSRSSSESSIGILKDDSNARDLFGKAVFWLGLTCLIAPLMLLVCIICWGLVFTIPMAKLNWALLQHLFTRPTEIRFCSAPALIVIPVAAANAMEESDGVPSHFVKPMRISQGQIAPSGSKASKVLLCVYRAMGSKYYKYTVGGVNILFVNLMPVVFLVIFDGIVLLRIAERYEHEGRHVPPLLAAVTSQGLIFVMSLLSVIPLSYFIGMAVASISAQSSIGMGAVINATFGSIIEIILYAIALSQGKGHLVEGSIVGSLLAGVLLMPGASMVSSAVRRKEQKFNAKSAGVTSMMLIMAIIGTLTPTLFYQTYGTFQLYCEGCPANVGTLGNPWVCEHCYYEHPDPVDDPFYQSTVKGLMYFCAVILVFSYLIGLWFSLRTHASSIWQAPQQQQGHHDHLPIHNRQSVYQKVLAEPVRSLARKVSNATLGHHSRPTSPLPRESTNSIPRRPGAGGPGQSPVLPRRVSYANPPAAGHLSLHTPLVDHVDHAMKNSAEIQNLNLPSPMTHDEFSRAVAVATVSALRHQQQQAHSKGAAAAAVRNSTAEGGEHGGHEAPSWSRTTSASVLLACTALYAIIAEILVDVVDVILKGSGIAEKFLGVTLFALVPNTTEFMNAMSFALNGNIALSMEIGSAYALQVCLLQIPAMVAFSAWYAPEQMGRVAYTFTLIFPRWDVIVLILSMFLMTYTYIEARSNYHRGSILILSYVVMISGFYLAPTQEQDKDDRELVNTMATTAQTFSLSALEYAKWYISSTWW